MRPGWWDAGSILVRDIRDLIEQPFNGCLRVFQALLSIELLHRHLRAVSIPRMNLARDPFDVECRFESLEFQPVGSRFMAAAP